MADEQPRDDKPRDDKPKDDKPKDDPPKRRRKMGPTGWLILLVVLVAAGVGGVYLWNYLQSYESTDDAQVDGDIYAITSRIAGSIRAVYVEDNQAVKAGQLLVELDPSDYQNAVEQAKAALFESRTQVTAARPNIALTTTTTGTTIATTESDIAAVQAAVAGAQRDREAAVAQLRQAEADNVKAQADLARYKQLVAKDEISQQQFDQAQAVAAAMAAQVDARRANG